MGKFQILSAKRVLSLHEMLLELEKKWTIKTRFRMDESVADGLNRTNRDLELFMANHHRFRILIQTETGISTRLIKDGTEEKRYNLMLNNYPMGNG